MKRCAIVMAWTGEPHSVTLGAIVNPVLTPSSIS